MTAKGKFEIDLEPQADPVAATGRMLISKTYEGDIEARGTGQMLSKRTDKYSGYFGYNTNRRWSQVYA